jgi:hypothetical protein
MLLALLLTLQSSGSLYDLLDPPDSSVWKAWLGYRQASTGDLPGSTTFDGGPYSRTESGGRSSGGALSIGTTTPERHRWAARGFLSVGPTECLWDRKPLEKRDPTDLIVEPRNSPVQLQVEAWQADVGIGLEFRPFRSHILWADLVSSFPLGRGNLKYTIDGATRLDQTAPASFRINSVPRLIVGYTYRLFDKIDLGLGYGLLHGSYFANTPSYQLDSTTYRLTGETNMRFDLRAAVNFQAP